MIAALRGFRSSGLGAFLLLTACVSPPPKPVNVQSPALAQSAPVMDPPPNQTTAQDQQVSPATSAVSSASGSSPTCSCVDTNAKPKTKPKPKAVRRVAPPQLPTEPVVEGTPPGGLVDAQVRSMSVSVMSILGKRVRGANGEDLGRVVDVLADASGRVRTAIIDFGGFLGVGNHRVAVDWPLLRFNPDGSDPSLMLSLAAEKLRTAPEYKDNPRPQILMFPTASTAAPAD